MRSSPQERFAVWILIVLLLLGCGAWWWRQERVSLASAHGHQGNGRLLSEPTEDAAPPAPRLLRVHVAGAVLAPGVYELPEGSRVLDALQAAGGPGPDASPHALNLAARLVDGERIWVPTARELAVPAAVGSGAPTRAGPTATSPVNINTAGSAELQSLPGIGPVLAERIIQYRRQHGPFTAVEELKNVSGIGEKRFNDLKHLVTVH